MKKWLNKIYRLKNKYREREDFMEIVLHNPDTNEEIISIIDKEDFVKVNRYTWRISKNGYVINRQVGYLHRYLLNPPNSLDVDHINHVKLDNRRSNLRICTRSQNSMNTKIPSNNTSGVKGVYKCKTTGKWATEIKVNGKKIWLGRYASLDEAREVRAKAEEKYFKDFRYKPIEVN